MTPLAEAVARVRASIDIHAPDNGDDLLVSGYTGPMRWGDLRTILAALPTPEERARGAMLLRKPVAPDAHAYWKLAHTPPATGATEGGA